MKRVLAVVIAFALLLISVQAYDGGIALPEDYFDENPGIVSVVAEQAAVAGGQIDFTVRYSRNGARELCFDVSYDTAVLTLINAVSVSQNGSVAQNGNKITYENEIDGIIQNQPIICLSFEVNGKAVDGSNTTVTLTNVEDEDYYSEDASITVAVINKAIIGDVNGDKVVNGDDLIVLQKYLAGWKGVTLESPDNADIDSDNKITARDRAILARYLAGRSQYNVYFE